jgi:hypothetical protein
MKKVLLLLIVLSSCAPVYIPNSRNSPMFQKGGEFQGSIALGNGVEAQTALSITNHFGIMGNFLYLDRTTTDDVDANDDDFRHHRFFEGGVGYFENQEKMFVEIFAGYGRGEGSSSDDDLFNGNSTARVTGKYNRYFIQPAFGFNKKVMNLSFVPRFSMVDFTEMSDGTFTRTLDDEPIFFFEPAVIGRVNFANNRIFFAFQAGISSSINSGRDFDHRPFQMSAGLGFRLGGIRPNESSDSK